MVDNLKRTGLPGVAVAITNTHRIIHLAGYGKDSEGNPITADTRMYIGSVSKSFTALAVMQLVDRGKIRLEDPVANYLPDFQVKDPRAQQITVSQLMNHSSGLADGGFPEMSLPQPFSLVEEMERLRAAHLIATPGSQWNYHNPNYHILARLVEQVSGESFTEYLKRHIFDPLQMDHTAAEAFVGDSRIPVTKGFMFAYGIPIARTTFPHFVSGSGGVISTANDMSKWIAMQNNGGKGTTGRAVVSRKALSAMHTPSGPDHDFAYGWEQDVLADGSKRIEHGGSLFTFSADAALFPETGYGFVVMFNNTSATGAEQLSFINGLTALVKNQIPELGNPASLIADSVLGFLSIILVMHFVRSVRGARTWARRFRGRAGAVSLRSVPYCAAILTGIFFLKLAGLLFGGRDVTLTSAGYGWPALLVFFEGLAFGSFLLLMARAFCLTHKPDVDGIGISIGV